MRIGLAFIPGMPYRDVVGIVREAEALGYDDVFLPDQAFHRDPWALLALCAAATKTVRLGLALTNPYTRHPIEIARAAGTIAETSEGRFVLGLGAGNRPRVLAGHGIEQVGIVDRVREAVGVIRRLLAGETVHHRSETLTVDGVALDFETPARVPVMLGTRGPRMLALAGEVADGVLFEGLFRPAAFDWGLAQVAKGAARAGRAAADVEAIAWQSLALGDEGLASEPAYRRWAALLIRTTRPAVLDAMGISDEAIAAVAGEAADGEPSGAGVPAADVRKLLMVGTPAEVRASVEGVREAGANGVACIVLGDASTVQRTMRRFAAEVMPGVPPRTE